MVYVSADPNDGLKIKYYATGFKVFDEFQDGKILERVLNKQRYQVSGLPRFENLDI